MKILLTECHRGSGFPKAFLVVRNAAILVFLGAILYGRPFLPLAHGDISLRADEKSSDSGRKSAIKPTVLLKTVAAEVIRGGEVSIPINVVSPDGQDIDLQISRPPSYGKLRPLVTRGGSSRVFLYLNDSSVKSPEDSFEFRVRVPGLAWSTHVASIRIQNPPGLLAVIPEKIDFGSVPIGTTSRRTLLLCNSFGAPVSGTLLLPSPWALAGDGGFSLAENESKSFEILFTPVEAKPESTELKVAPELAGFPSVPLSGEGIVPFLIDTNSSIVSKEHPKAAFRITNSSGKEMRLGWDDENGLLCSPPIVIPPGGNSEVWVSVASIRLETEERRVFHPCLCEGGFSLPLEIIALGAPGKVSLKPEEGELVATAGSAITLKGQIENTSSVPRSLELLCPGGDVGEGGARHAVTIPPHASQPFLFSWSTSSAGQQHPKVLLGESGRILDQVQYNVNVTPPVASPRRAPSSDQPLTKAPGALPLPKSGFYRLPRSENRCLVAKLSSALRPGIFSNSLILRWLYLGDASPQFVIEEKINRNALTDRTGEAGDDSWRRLRLSPRRLGGAWEATFQMPWPGEHVFRVYPAGSPVVLMSQLTLRVTWDMFLRPALRSLLIVALLLGLIRLMRERL